MPPIKKSSKKHRQKRGGGSGSTWRKDEDSSVAPAATAGSGESVAKSWSISRNALVTAFSPLVDEWRSEEEEGEGHNSVKNSKKYDLDWHSGYIAPKNNPNWSLCRNSHVLAAEWDSCIQQVVKDALKKSTKIVLDTVLPIGRRTSCNMCRHNLMSALQGLFTDDTKMRTLLDRNSVTGKLRMESNTETRNTKASGGHTRDKHQLVLTLHDDVDTNWVDDLLNKVQQYPYSGGDKCPPWYLSRIDSDVCGETSSSFKDNPLHKEERKTEHDVDMNSDGVDYLWSLQSSVDHAIQTASDTAKYIDSRKAILGKEDGARMSFPSSAGAAASDGGSSLSTAQNKLHETHDQLAQVIRDTSKFCRTLDEYSAFLREHLVSNIAMSVKQGSDPLHWLPKQLIDRMQTYMDVAYCSVEGSSTRANTHDLGSEGVNVKEYIKEVYEHANTIGQATLIRELNQYGKKGNNKNKSTSRILTAIEKVNMVGDILNSISRSLMSCCDSLRKLCWEVGDTLSQTGIELANEYGIVTYLPANAEFFTPLHELRPCQFFTGEEMGCVNASDTSYKHSAGLQKVEVSEHSTKTHLRCSECGEIVNACCRGASPHWSMWEDVLRAAHEQTSKRARMALHRYCNFWRGDMVALQGRLLAAFVQNGFMPLRKAIGAQTSPGSIFQEITQTLKPLLSRPFSRLREHLTNVSVRENFISTCLQGDSSSIHLWLGRAQSIPNAAKRTVSSYWHKVIDTTVSWRSGEKTSERSTDELSFNVLLSAMCATFAHLRECGNRVQSAVTLPFRFPLESIRVGSVRWSPNSVNKENSFSSLSQMLPLLGYSTEPESHLQYLTSRSLCTRILEARIKQWVHALIFASHVFFDVWHVIRHSVPATQHEQLAWKTTSRHIETMFDVNPESHSLLQKLSEFEQQLSDISDDNRLKQEISRQYPRITQSFGKRATSYDANVLRGTLAHSKGFASSAPDPNRWATVATKNIECMKTEEDGLSKAYNSLIDAISLAEAQSTAIASVFYSLEHILSLFPQRKETFCRDDNVEQHYQWILYDAILTQMERVDELYMSSEDKTTAKHSKKQPVTAKVEPQASVSENKKSTTEKTTRTGRSKAPSRSSSMILGDSSISVVEGLTPTEIEHQDDSAWVTVNRSKKSQSTSRRNKRRNKNRGRGSTAEDESTLAHSEEPGCREQNGTLGVRQNADQPRVTASVPSIDYTSPNKEDLNKVQQLNEKESTTKKDTYNFGSSLSVSGKAKEGTEPRSTAGKPHPQEKLGTLERVSDYSNASEVKSSKVVVLTDPDGQTKESSSKSRLAYRLQSLCETLIVSNDESRMKLATEALQNIITDETTNKDGAKPHTLSHHQKGEENQVQESNSSMTITSGRPKNNAQILQDQMKKSTEPDSTGSRTGILDGSVSSNFNLRGRNRPTVPVPIAAVQDVHPRQFGVRMIAVEDSTPTVPWYSYPTHVFNAEGGLPVWTRRQKQ